MSDADMTERIDHATVEVEFHDVVLDHELWATSEW
jgi:hypothetical protein